MFVFNSQFMLTGWYATNIQHVNVLQYILTGTGTHYQFSPGTVINGNYDDTSGTLTVTDGNGNPEGQVTLADKSFRGKLKANGKWRFTIHRVLPGLDLFFLQKNTRIHIY